MEVTDIRRQADILSTWRNGRIVMKDGCLVAIRRRFWPTPASIARVWLQTRFNRGTRDECTLEYRSARPGGFIVLDYIHSGPQTQLATFRGACQILDEIARLRGAVAILAHVSTDAISDRLLRRWGWEPHANHMAGRHWIKRFYDGYPTVDLNRYCNAR
jgi:hypothetical protein